MMGPTYNDITEAYSLIKQTDKLRGDVSKSTYIRAIENYLKKGEDAVMIIVLGITRVVSADSHTKI
ncbi:MAG: hypothetical protein WA364_29265 [Candidatus Nitrosopolaris sp.]